MASYIQTLFFQQKPFSVSWLSALGDCSCGLKDLCYYDMMLWMHGLHTT